MPNQFLRFYFSMNVIMLVMLLISYPFLEPGSASAVVAKLAFAVVIPSILVSAYLIYRETRGKSVLPSG